MLSFAFICAKRFSPSWHDSNANKFFICAKKSFALLTQQQCQCMHFNPYLALGTRVLYSCTMCVLYCTAVQCVCCTVQLYNVCAVLYSCTMHVLYSCTLRVLYCTAVQCMCCTAVHCLCCTAVQCVCCTAVLCVCCTAVLCVCCTAVLCVCCTAVHCVCCTAVQCVCCTAVQCVCCTAVQCVCCTAVQAGHSSLSAAKQRPFNQHQTRAAVNVSIQTASNSRNLSRVRLISIKFTQPSVRTYLVHNYLVQTTIVQTTIVQTTIALCMQAGHSSSSTPWQCPLVLPSALASETRSTRTASLPWPHRWGDLCFSRNSNTILGDVHYDRNDV